MAKNRRFQAPNLTFQTTQLTFTPVDIDENMGTAHLYGRIIRRIKIPCPTAVGQGIMTNLLFPYLRITLRMATPSGSVIRRV